MKFFHGVEVACGPGSQVTAGQIETHEAEIMEMAVGVLTVVGILWALLFGSRTIPEWWRERRAASRRNPARPGFTTDSSTVLHQDTARLTSVAVDSQGERVAFAGFAGEVKVFNLATRVTSVVARHHAIIRAVCFAPPGGAVASACDDGLIRLTYLDSQSGRILGKHTGPVYSLAFDASGDHVHSAGKDGFIRTWPVAQAPILVGSQQGEHSEIEPFAIRRHAEGCVFCVRSHPARRLLVTSGVNGVVRLWNLAHGSDSTLGTSTQTVFSVAFASPLQSIASAGADGSVHLWQNPADVPTRFAGHRDSVRHVAFHRGGRLLASASKDRTIRIWDCHTRHCWVLSGHTDYVYAVEFDPVRERIFSVGGDGELRSWPLPFSLPK